MREVNVGLGRVDVVDWLEVRCGAHRGRNYPLMRTRGYPCMDTESQESVYIITESWVPIGRGYFSR